MERGVKRGERGEQRENRGAGAGRRRKTGKSKNLETATRVERVWKEDGME